MKIILDYDYIKSHYRFIAVDLSRQEEVDADPKAIQLVEFIEQTQNTDGQYAGGTRSIFVLTILEKIKETRLKFSQGSVTVL